MNLKHTLIIGALTGFMATPLFADTFTGKLVYKDASGNVVAKSGEVELSADRIEAIKLKIENNESVADKVRVKVVETEQRQIVVALFRNIRDMPEGSTLILKGSLIEGNNGKLFYGDVFTRTCAKSAEGNQSQSDDEDGYLDRLLDKVQAFQDRKGCAAEYRGGLLVAHSTSADQH